MSWLDFDRYVAELVSETARLADTLHDLDLDAPVPTCPEWTVADWRSTSCVVSVGSLASSSAAWTIRSRCRRTCPRPRTLPRVRHGSRTGRVAWRRPRLGRLDDAGVDVDRRSHRRFLGTPIRARRARASIRRRVGRGRYRVRPVRRGHRPGSRRRVRRAFHGRDTVRRRRLRVGLPRLAGQRSDVAVPRDRRRAR